jgi:hypothetical protein
VAVGAAFFAAAFRASLGLIYRVFYDATQVVVEAFQQLPPWMRLVVVAFGAFTAGLIADCRLQCRRGSAMSWRLLLLETYACPSTRR